MENGPNLEITEVILLIIIIKEIEQSCNNNYQRNWTVMYTFIPNKSFGQLPYIFQKKIPSEFAYTEVCFTNQNFNPLEIEDKMNIALIIDQSQTYKKWQLFSLS